MRQIFIISFVLVLYSSHVVGQFATWTGVSVPVGDFGFTHKPAISYGAGWQNRSWNNRLVWQTILTRAVHHPRLDTIPSFTISGPNYPYLFRPEKISHRPTDVWQLSFEARFRILFTRRLELFGGVGAGATLARTATFRQIEGDTSYNYSVNYLLKCASLMVTTAWRINGHLSLFADFRYQSVSDFYRMNPHNNRSVGVGIWYHINDLDGDEAK